MGQFIQSLFNQKRRKQLSRDFPVNSYSLQYCKTSRKTSVIKVFFQISGKIDVLAIEPSSQNRCLI